MKTVKSSELSNNRAAVFKEAKANGVIIQECNTNCDVRCEYVLLELTRYNGELCWSRDGVKEGDL